MNERESLNQSRESWSYREVTEGYEHADDALRNYAESLRFWNAPDYEHSRIQLRALVEAVIKDVLP